MRGLRPRWNAHQNEPELSTGYGATLAVRAEAFFLLYPGFESRKTTSPETASGATRERLADVARWAIEHRSGVLKAAALAERRARFQLGTSSFLASTSEKNHGDGDMRPRSSFLASGEARANDLAFIAERAADAVARSFTGRVVDAIAVTSRQRKEAETHLGNGSTTTRPTLWVTQDCSGMSTEVALRAASKETAEALLRDLPGRVVRFRNFFVRRRVYENGRHAFALVQIEEDDTEEGHAVAARAAAAAAAGEFPETRVSVPDASKQFVSTWEIVPETDALAANVAARCPPRRASADARTLRDVFDADALDFEREGSKKTRCFSNDAAIVVVKARVAWVRLPAPRAARRVQLARATTTETKRVTEKKRFSGRNVAFSKKNTVVANGGFLATREEIANALIATGCTRCGRELFPDALDGTYRQCVCHSGETNTVGKVWRALELGLGDAGSETEDEFANETITRVARVDASLVSRLLLGARAENAWLEANATVAPEAAEDAAAPAHATTHTPMIFPEKKNPRIHHLSLAVAALTALAAGSRRNATPFTWYVRAPPPDSNGVCFHDGAPLDIVDFDISAEKK